MSPSVTQISLTTELLLRAIPPKSHFFIRAVGNSICSVGLLYIFINEIQICKVHSIVLGILFLTFAIY